MAEIERMESAVADVSDLVRDAGPHPRTRASRNAGALVGSEILKIASEMRALRAAGRTVW